MAASRTLIVAGAITLVLGLVLVFPAAVAYRWIGPQGVTLNGISGSVWNGAAHEGSFGGIYAADLRWRFRPLALFAGRAQFAVVATPASGFIEGDLAVAAGGGLVLKDISASLPIQAFERVFTVTGLHGDVNLRIDRLVVEDGLPSAAEGSVSLVGLVIEPLSASPLGDYSGTFTTDDGTIRGSVEDVSGVLDVSATVELRPDRNYALAGLIAARPDAPPAVDQQLRFLGSADAQGRRPFRFEGRL